jgi:hypothetical protein
MEHNHGFSKIIVVNYNEKNYQFSTELIKPVNIFYNEICSYFQINPNNYILFFNKKKVETDNNSQQLVNIIKKNQNIPFKIIPKKLKLSRQLKIHTNTISQENIKSITSRKMPSSNFLTISNEVNRSNGKLKNKKYNNVYDNASVVISQIPSVKDIKVILNEFNNKLDNNNNNKSKNYLENCEGILTEIGHNSVRIDFKSESTLNKFISYISFIKYENNNFKNIIIQKNNSSFKNLNINNKTNNNMHIINNITSSYKNLPKNNQKFNKKYNYSEISININDVIRALKQQNQSNNDSYHGLSLHRDNEHEIITDYYRKQMYLRNSSPYISENEKRILEEKEKKKKFFKNKNFITSVGKYSMKPNFIPNYVGMTPSINPNEYEFRKVNKNKWITIKGFN